MEKVTNFSERRYQAAVGAKRVVVKVGSGVLTTSQGLNTERIDQLSEQISKAIGQGREIVLVSSGAIASGFKKIGLSSKPKTIRHQQACAAIGQATVIMEYEKSLEGRGHKVAQILLTAADLIHRRRYINAKNTLKTLLEWRVIPIINENDTVVTDEIKFGDNDTLAGLITGLVEADLFINLTDIDGLYDCDPRQNASARFLSEVETVNDSIESMASKIPGAMGAGGMYTKVVAARRVGRQGVPSIIANGARDGILDRILSGEEVGTLFIPQEERLNGRKQWIAFTSNPKGHIVVDDGARNALLKRGKSLLPIGVLSVNGRFDLGDSVRVIDKDGDLVAVGLANYSSEDMKKIAGCQTGEISARLGYRHSATVIHRDNMVVGGHLDI